MTKTVEITTSEIASFLEHSNGSLSYALWKKRFGKYTTYVLHFIDLLGIAKKMSRSKKRVLIMSIDEAKAKIKKYDKSLVLKRINSYKKRAGRAKDVDVYYKTLYCPNDPILKIPLYNIGSKFPKLDIEGRGAEFPVGMIMLQVRKHGPNRLCVWVKSDQILII